EVKIFASSSTHWSDSSNDETAASYRMIDAPTGTVTISATAGSRKTRPVVVEVEPNSEVRADLHFPETFPIRGRVLRDAGPLCIESIEFNDDTGQRTTAFAESDGTYKVELPAGQYHVTVGNYSVDHAVSGPETFDINVDLASITVTVVDALTGAPIDDAEVSGYGIGGGGKTDRNGQVTLDAPRGLQAIEV